MSNTLSSGELGNTTYHLSKELMTKLKEEGYYINLVLEYVGGGDIREYLLKKGALSEDEALHWLKHLGIEGYDMVWS